MTRHVIRIVIVTILWGGAREAGAQPTLRFTDDSPATEVALFSGAWSLEQGGFAGVGGRLTVNHTGWFATEGSLEGKKAGPFGPAQGMLIVNGRILTPMDPTQTSALVLSAGGAVAMGLRRALLPMVGVGTQRVSQDGGFAVRADVQVFPGGPVRQRRRARLTVGVVVLLR